MEVLALKYGPTSGRTELSWAIASSTSAIAMDINDGPSASAGNAVFMSVLGGAFLLLALFLHPLLRRSDQACNGGTR